MGKFLSCLLLVQLIVISAFGQQKNIKGSVISNDNNEVLPGVSIKVKGSKTVTQTDADGNFQVDIAGNSELEFAYVGYQTLTVRVRESESSIKVGLIPNDASLKEVVITGYGREKRQQFSGVAAVLTAQQINQVPVGSFEHALQGQASGVYVTAGSGQPGSAARLIVRGVSTINGSTNPLFIVDDVPTESTIVYAINSADIQSVTVLKDAAATALYGSRGSNGVVVVTTKRGAVGPLKFNYNSQLGVSVKNNDNYSMMTSAQRLQFEEEVGIESPDTWRSVSVPGWNFSDRNPANLNLSDAAKAVNARILDSLRNINTDWRDVFFRNGKYQRHNVSASGGTDKIRFFSSGEYFDQDGIAEESYMKRYAFRTNLDFTEKRFSANVSLGLGYSRTSGIENENNSSSFNPFASVYYALPYEQPYINGVLYHPGNAGSAPNPILDQREGSSAIERMLDATSASDLIKAMFTTKLQYKLTDDLYATTTFGVDFRDLDYIRTLLTRTVPTSQAKLGSYTEVVNRNLQYVSTSGINYKKSWADKHQLDLKGLFELNRLKYKSTTFVGNGINPKLLGSPAGIPNSTTAPSMATGSRTQSALVSLIGLATYNYDKRYSINVNYRYDGSSVVGRDNRWTGFYSAGLSWNAKEEEFLKDIYFLDGLKFRGSYGKTGSQFPGNFNAFSTYETTKYSGATGIVANSPGNSDYNWEITHQLNFGTDFSLLKNRIYGSFDWYNKTSSNLFIDQPLSSTSGFITSRINAGKMRNRGIEGELFGDIVSKKDFFLRIGANFNYNKNKVLDLGQLSDFIVGTTIVREGLPFGTQYAVKWAGVFMQTGDAMYFNRDGTITNTYDPANQNVTGFGSYIPPFVGGFTSNIKYKDFSLNALFSFVNGYYRLNNEPLYNESPSFATSNKSTAILRRWRNPGDITDIQRYDRNSARRLSSKDIEDASYIRFRNLTLGYTIPRNLSSKLRVRNAMVYLQGQNLYTWTKWTGFDPEDNNNISMFEYPTARTFSLGLNVNF
ncbi:SusC/RagA family TonB-linked outer membrane protein [Desertivirga brevis]|uniref:SusC/RagA family TonB-linked outer membrane protein n=1 Tax=Desertivirga brevis TaxID=2810310 RepID=UPI001A95D5FB|nr:SusC/RagA family TonB-linked outer membrane protein [Pedobacter sp. SYSU D00873]